MKSTLLLSGNPTIRQKELLGESFYLGWRIDKGNVLNRSDLYLT
jgi:hypothetical protein